MTDELLRDNMSASYRDRAQLWAFMQHQEDVQHERMARLGKPASNRRDIDYQEEHDGNIGE